MIKSLFRQMWNQRHANVWVWVELVVVLVLLWYSIDLVYNYEVAARQSKGYDTENVFDIQLNIKPALQNDSVLMSHSAEYLEQIYHLIQQYQGVLSFESLPYLFLHILINSYHLILLFQLFCHSFTFCHLLHQYIKL